MQYLAEFPHGEIGWTPETYIVAFRTALEREGQVLDGETASFLIGAYQPASGDVPSAFRLPNFGQMHLRREYPVFWNPADGVRVV